jgi:small subunit ribosomal protein S19e
MTTIYDVPQNELVERVALKLKTNSKISPPAWAAFSKTGVSKERPPMRQDWWHVRTAAVLLKIYKKGPIGVAKLRTYYGSKKNRGVKPELFKKGSGNIIRKSLQQLDAAGFTKKAEIGVHKGRVLTKEGKMFLESVSQDLKANPTVKQKKIIIAEKPKSAPKADVPSREHKKKDAAAPKQSKKGDE